MTSMPCLLGQDDDARNIVQTEASIRAVQKSTLWPFALRSAMLPFLIETLFRCDAWCITKVF
ncbi:MAG: hypothetical protein DYH04_13160 [Nitrospira sp. NTP2]|nr:hypothetical protein [Nitrospira sp. NTP2]RIK60597.1 MAG: hypothetical protein DCC63_02915 [Nitrospira sp.]